MKFRAHIAASQNGATVINNKHVFSYILNDLEIKPLLLGTIIMDMDTFKDIHPYLNKFCRVIVYDPTNTDKAALPNNSTYITDISVETLALAIGYDADWVTVFGTADFFKLFTDEWLMSEVQISKLVINGEESQFIDYETILEGYERTTAVNQPLITTELWCFKEQLIPITSSLSDEEFADVAVVMQAIIDGAFERFAEGYRCR